MPPIVREAAKDPARHLGRFVIVRELGQGAMGTVHQAWDTGFGRWAAIKLLKSGLADEESLERFRREASVMTSLDHPNIAPAYDVVDFDGKLALIMKYIEGRTLHEIYLQDRRGPASFEVVVKHIRDACLGLGYAHGRGLVHRDLKPANLMVDRESRVYVLDFGLAKVLKKSVGLTDLGRIMGTPAYMSPEQAKGLSHEVDARSDVFSLGVTLWTLLAGYRPFKGRTDLEVAKAIVEEPAPSLRSHRHETPEEIDLVLQKAMDKDRYRRHPTAVELASELNDCLVALENSKDSWARFDPVATGPEPATVFLIEDDLALATLVRRFLAKDRIDLVHFADGAEAIQSVKDAVPDVVLLDVNLPGLSGWQILERLRKLPSYSHVPIIMVTGERGEENVVRGYHLGANDYIEKPFSMGVLRARLRHQLQMRHVDA